MTPATPKPRAGEHTKGPWSVGKLVSGHGDQFDICAAPGIAVAMIPGGNGNDYANARRIVAAVNACEGVPIDELEGLAALKCDIPGLAGVAQMAVVNSEHEDERDSLRERGRELVAALQAIASADIRYQSSEIAIKARSSNQNIAEQVTAYDLRQRAIEQARALLAKHGR